MISATPNSVRWDQVNRVSYRFQALNFQSDVLEALVLNSPPLTRRTRRKSIIRVVNSSGDRVEFLQARSLERRSQSFDEAITNLTKHDAKFCEKVRVNDDRYAPGKDGIDSLKIETRQKHNVVIETGTDVENETEISAKLAKEPSGRNNIAKVITELECGCGKNSELDDCDILCDKNDDYLESRSKEYLIQLVKKLRNRVRDLSETNSSRTSSVTGDIHQDCRTRNELCGKSEKINDGNRGISTKEEMCHACPVANTAFSYQDCMAVNMKQLESEVIRTRKIASMFEDELSGLKSKFSTLLGTKNATEKRSKLPSNAQRTKLEKGYIEDTVRADSNENWLKLNLDSFQSKSERNLCWAASNVPEVVIPEDIGVSH